MNACERMSTAGISESPHAYLTPFGRLPAARLRVPDWDGFNGALISSQGNTLLVYRTTRDNPSLASCYLDGDLRMIPSSHRPIELHRNADPRLVEFCDQVYLVTPYFGGGFEHERIELRKVTLGSHAVEALDVVAKFDHIDNDPTYIKRREKNWAPFVHEDGLYFVHRMRSHRVLRYDPAARRVALTAQAPWS